MKHLATAVNQTEFGGITQIRPGNRGGNIAECIRTVRQRFVLIVKHLFLNRQVVDAEWLTAIVHRTRRRTVRVC